MRRADEGRVNARLNALPEHLLVGLSGGADSVALLLLLKERGGRIEAAHVNHGLRGDASDGDEAFVRALCEAWNIPLRIYRATPPEHPSEEWAREARYGFLRQAMRETGAEALALAHHRDDQAETLLMHLVRGSGLKGMTGMAPDATRDGIRVVRPLLGVSGRELRALLTERGQGWREDASNRDQRYLRNFLRLEIMPKLERYAPGVAARMAETALLLREDEEALQALAEEFLGAQGGERQLALAVLMTKPVGLQKRILRLWWDKQGLPPLDRAQTNDLLALVRAAAGSRCNLPQGWHGQRGWTHLHLIKPGVQEAPEAVQALDGAVMSGVTLTLGTPDGTMGDGRSSQLVPTGLMEGTVLRTWKEGDWIRPYGMTGRKSLQDYFTDKRVDAPFRHRVPLLCRGAEVLLACGVGAGGIPTMHETEGVMLRWAGPMPWLNDLRKDENHDGNKRDAVR